MVTDFVDRQNELAWFRDDILQHRGSTRIVLLVGPSGVGKSALTSQLIKSLAELPSVKARVLHGEAERSEDGHLLRRLGRALNHVAETRGRLPTFRSFLRDLKTPQVRKGLVDALKREFVRLGPLAGILVESYDRYQGAGRFDPDMVFASTASDVAVNTQAYAAHVLQTAELVLSVENIHSVDSFSLEFLGSALAAARGAYVLLEYTTGQPGGWRLEHVSGHFQACGLDVQITELERLATADALLLLQRRPGNLESFVQRTYSGSDGNLRPLVDINVHLKFNRDRFAEDIRRQPALALAEATQLNIDYLSRSQLATLTAIVVHGGSVERALLRAMTSAPGVHEYGSQLDDDIDVLISRDLVDQARSTLSIRHDTIASQILTAGRYEKYRIVCASHWRRLYSDALDEDGDFLLPRREALLQLLSFSLCLGEPEEALERLQDIGRYASTSRHPQRLLSYVEELRRKLASNVDVAGEALLRDVNMALVELCYALGFYGGALDRLGDVAGGGKREVVYEAAVLGALDRQEEAIALCTQQLALNRGEDLLFELALELVRLAALRSTNLHDECAELFRVLMSQHRFADLDAYGFLLRSAELALPSRQAIRYLSESLDWFRERGLAKESALARIALSLHLGYMGNLAAAENHLCKAQEEMEGEVIERHTLLNNLAVIRLLRRQYDDETEELLRHAAMTATEPFESLGVRLNSMIHFSERGDHERAGRESMAAASLMNSGRPREGNVRRIAHYNIAIASQRAGRLKAAERSLEEARAVDCKVHAAYWRHRLYAERCTDPAYAFRMRHPFDPVFLTYWRLDVGSRLWRSLR